MLTQNPQSLTPSDLETIANCLIVAKAWLQKTQAVATHSPELLQEIDIAVESCRTALLAIDIQIAKARKS